MEDFLLQGLAWAMSKSSAFVAVAAALGTIRLLVKPIMKFLQEIVIYIPGDKDDKLLAKVLESKAFKAIIFLLDYLGSIKVAVKKEDPKVEESK